MTIIVETGAGTDPTANCYDSAANVMAFLDSRGYTIDATEDAVAKTALAAMEFIEGMDYAGTIASTSQPLAFPRSGVTLSDGRILLKTQIPQQLKRALAWCVYYQISGAADLAAKAEPQVISEKIDVLEFGYSRSAASSLVSDELSDLPLVMVNLRELLAAGGDAMGGSAGLLDRA